jgi:hypothetical protein
MKKIILCIGATLFFLALSTRINAADPESAPDTRPKTHPIVSEKDANQNTLGLEQRMSPEDLERFNRNMEAQTEEAYPDRAKIESRRKNARERMQEQMQQADTDNDNSISRTEAEESMPGVARHFDEIDANHDNVITYDEMKAAQEKKHKTAGLQAKQDNEKKEPPKKKKKSARKKNNAPPKESGQEQSSNNAPVTEVMQ